MLNENKKLILINLCDKLIILSVLFITFTIPFERSFDFPNQLVQYLALLCLITKTFLTRKIKLPPLFISIPFILYTIFSIITIFTSTYPDLSFKIFFREFLHYIIIFLCVLSLYNTQNRIKLIVLLIVIVSLFISIVDIIPYYLYILKPELRERLIDLKFIFPDPDGSFRPLMPFHYHNRFATYLMITSLYFFTLITFLKKSKNKIIFGVLSLFPIYCLILTLTRAAWIGFATGVLILLVYFVMKDRKKIILLLILLIVIVSVASFSGMIRNRFLSLFKKESYKEISSTIKGRFLGYQGALKMIKEKPLLGFGFGWKVFEKIYPNYMPSEEYQLKRHAHSNYLEIGTESGLITLFFYLWFSIAIFYALIKLVLTSKKIETKEIAFSFIAILISIYVNGLGNFSLRKTIGMIIWITLGLSISVYNMLKEKENQNP